MRCEELMTADPEVLEARGTVSNAAAKMRDANVGFLPIVDDAEQVVGVLTDRDLVVRVMAEGLSLETRAEEVMTADVISCRPDDDL
jgi:CBS domain-containing protein